MNIFYFKMVLRVNLLNDQIIEFEYSNEKNYILCSDVCDLTINKENKTKFQIVYVKFYYF